MTQIRLNLKRMKVSLAFAVIALSAVSILILGLINRFSIFQYQQSEASRVADMATLTYQANIETYIFTLYGVRGFLNSSFQPTRADFNQFVTSLAIPRRLPGATAVGFAKLIKDYEKNAFISEVRNDTTLDRAGYPEFSIRPTVQNPEYLVITYVEPSNLTTSKEAMGFDMLSDQRRVLAYQTARDTNRAIFTSTVIDSATGQDSFVLMLPVYDQSLRVVSVEERRQAVTGVVAMSLKRANLFNSSFDVFLEKNPTLRIRVYEGEERNEDALLYDSDQDKQVLGAECCQAMATEVRNFERAGIIWTIEYTLPQQRTALIIPYPVMALPLLAIILFSCFGFVVSIRTLRPISI